MLQQVVFAFFLRHPTSFARHSSPPSPPPHIMAKEGGGGGRSDISLKALKYSSFPPILKNSLKEHGPLNSKKRFLCG